MNHFKQPFIFIGKYIGHKYFPREWSFWAKIQVISMRFPTYPNNGQRAEVKFEKPGKVVFKCVKVKAFVKDVLTANTFRKLSHSLPTSRSINQSFSNILLETNFIHIACLYGSPK